MGRNSLREGAKAAFVACALFSSPIAASKPYTSEWGEWDNWRFIGDIDYEPTDDWGGSGRAAMFFGRVEHLGSAATVEVLFIYGKPEATYGADQAHSTFLVDCSTLEYRLTGAELRGPNAAIPPPITRIEDNPAPESGSAMRSVLEATCGRVPMPDTKVAEPYGWAKQHLAERSP